jgi:hypothetical protein
LFYLPVAMVAFTRFGYLMRRSFFRLMLGDLNGILDGLTELEEKGVQTIDCRRAQFSAQEPIIRLRVICQSWKVMFQAEYSSGQPLRMLVDLRASVEHALGRGKPAEPEVKAQGAAKAVPAAKAAPVAKAAPALQAKPAAKPVLAAKAATGVAKPATSAAAAGSTAVTPATKATVAPAAAKPENTPADPAADEPEFEVSSTPGWDPYSTSTTKNE